MATRIIDAKGRPGIGMSMPSIKGSAIVASASCTLAYAAMVLKAGSVAPSLALCTLSIRFMYSAFCEI